MKRPNILLVDDNRLFLEMEKDFLQPFAVMIYTARSGQEALDVVRMVYPDLVFMDLHMPDMDGMEASRQIRAWENGGTHTFIVALTASYLPEIGQALFDAGFIFFLASQLGLFPGHRFKDHIEGLKSGAEELFGNVIYLLFLAFLVWDFIAAPAGALIGPLEPHLLLVLAWGWLGIYLIRMPDSVWRGRHP